MGRVREECRIVSGAHAGRPVLDGLLRQKSDPAGRLQGIHRVKLGRRIFLIQLLLCHQHIVEGLGETAGQGEIDDGTSLRKNGSEEVEVDAGGDLAGLGQVALPLAVVEALQEVKRMSFAAA